MQQTLCNWKQEEVIHGHYWGDYRKTCALNYDLLGEHAFIDVEKEFGRFSMEIQTNGAVKSIICNNCNEFWNYVFSDKCRFFAIWWEEKHSEGRTKIIIKDLDNKMKIFS